MDSPVEHIGLVDVDAFFSSSHQIKKILENFMKFDEIHFCQRLKRGFDVLKLIHKNQEDFFGSQELMTQID